MFKRLALVISVLLFASSLWGQTTNVTATVTDPGSHAYANGSYSITFVPYIIGSQSTLNGSTFQQSFTGTLDGSGNLSVTLADNNRVQPANSEWRFYICSVLGTPCFQTQITITGTSQNITTQLDAAAPLLTSNIVVNPQQGSASVKPFPSNAPGLQIVANSNQTAPLAVFTTPQGGLGMAITQNGLIFPDGTFQTTAGGGGGSGDVNPGAQAVAVYPASTASTVSAAPAFQYNPTTGAVSIAPNSGQDFVALTLAPNTVSPLSDIFDVYADSAKTIKCLSVLTGGTIAAGTPGQANPCPVLLTGGSTSNAGPYIEGTNSSGTNPSFLYFDPTASGTLSIETSTHTGAATAGNIICTEGNGQCLSGSGTNPHLAFWGPSGISSVTDFTYTSHTLLGSGSAVLDLSTNGSLFKANSMQPSTDSTAAMRFFKADGSSVMQDFDTTDGRVCILCSTPATTLDVNGVINAASSIQAGGSSTMAGIAVFSNGATAPNGLANNIVYAGINNTTPCVLINTTGTTCTPLANAATAPVGISATGNISVSGNGAGPVQVSQLNDSNGNELVGFTATASAVDFFNIQNGASGTPGTVTLFATGTDSAVKMLFRTKNTGPFVFQPGADSSTAFAVFNAAASTAVIDVDTTNTRLGVGGTPSTTFDVGPGNFNMNASGLPLKSDGMTLAGVGLTSVLGVSNNTAQTGSLGAQALIGSVPAAGQYKISYYIDESTACTTVASGGVLATFSWTDATRGRTLATATLSADTTGVATDYVQGTISVWAASGGIAYTTTYNATCGTGGPFAYDIHATVERVQ